MDALHTTDWGISRFTESYLYGAKTVPCMYYATATSFYIRIYSNLMTINS